VRRVYEEHGSLTLFRLSQTRFAVFFNQKWEIEAGGCA